MQAPVLNSTETGYRGDGEKLMVNGYILGELRCNEADALMKLKMNELRLDRGRSLCA